MGWGFGVGVGVGVGVEEGATPFPDFAPEVWKFQSTTALHHGMARKWSRHCLSSKVISLKLMATRQLSKTAPGFPRQHHRR